MKIRIYLKSGAALPDFRGDEWSLHMLEKNGFLPIYKGEKFIPAYIDYSEIAAVVRIEDETEE